MNILQAPTGLYWVVYPGGGGTLFFKKDTCERGWATGDSIDVGCSSWSEHTFTRPYDCLTVTLSPVTSNGLLERVEAKVTQ